MNNNKCHIFFMLFFVVIGFLLISLNEILTFFELPKPPDLVLKITFGIGEAITIAGLLGLTVDFYVKITLSREVLYNNAIYFFMSHLDKPIQDEVSALVRGGFNPCRENLRVNYRLTDSNIPQGYVQAIIKLEYTVSNNSDEKKEFTHRISVKKIPESVQFTDKDKQILEVIGENVCMSTFSKDTESYVLKRRGNDKQLNYIEEKDNKEGTRKVWEKNVFIPAKSKSNFTSKYMQILPVTYEETLPSRWPTKNIIVDVEHPDNMVVFVAFNHRCRDQFSKSGENKWIFNYVMLPYQAIYIRWRPKKLHE